MSKIFEIYGSDAHAMTMSLMEAANVADMIPKGGSVALKPNLVVAGRPEEGGTTHAGVLSGCMEYLQNHGFTNISVIEGSWVGDDTAGPFRVAGYDKVCKKYGVPYYDLKRDKTRTVKTAMRSMEICCRALDTDFLINLPVLKGHCQDRDDLRAEKLQGVSAGQGEAPLPLRGAPEAHRRPGGLPQAPAHHCGQHLRGPEF